MSALSLAAPARADANDWLAVLPACALEGPPHAPVAVQYPRPGRPALVEAGATLIARVALPVALTPPPGIQQARALQGFAAALTTQTLSLDSRRHEQRYVLSVHDVRPDGPASLIYRLSIRIPAWLAPDTYDLWLRAPGTAAHVRGAVRVLEKGKPPRLAWLDAPGNLERSVGLPVDAWLVAGVAAGDAIAEPPPGAAPWLSLRQAALALRIGGERLLVLGGCEGGPLAEAPSVRGVLKHEGRSLARLDAVALPQDSYAPLDGAPRPLPARGAFALRPAAGGVEVVAAADVFQPTEVALRVPAAGATVRGAVRWFPGFDLARADTVPAALAQLRIAPGERASIRPNQAQREAPEAGVASGQIEMQPSPSYAGQRVALRLRGVPEAERVAWRLGEDDYRWAGREIGYRAWQPGAVSVHALALGPHGELARAHAELAVQPARSVGCSAAVGAEPGLGGLWTALVLLKRRRRQTHGNRLRRAPG